MNNLCEETNLELAEADIPTTKNIKKEIKEAIGWILLILAASSLCAMLAGKQVCNDAGGVIRADLGIDFGQKYLYGKCIGINLETYNIAKNGQLTKDNLLYDNMNLSNITW